MKSYQFYVNSTLHSKGDLTEEGPKLLQFKKEFAVKGSTLRIRDAEARVTQWYLWEDNHWVPRDPEAIRDLRAKQQKEGGH